MGFDNILEHDGIGIALTGMTIVFVALMLISGFIALLPKFMQVFSAFLPPETHHDAATPRSAGEDEAVIAAIGFVLHQREQEKRQQ